jgi:EAL domain-containing protein (putative c-di-GMP-specific phosphodiesterase class I)
MSSSSTGAGTERLSIRAPGGGFARPAPAGARISSQISASRLSSAAGPARRPWLSRLRAALRDRSFTLHFQPIVSLVDGSVSQHEALLRLADEPDGSLVSPGRFLPAAERYGLIGQIDRMVLEDVSALLGAERAAGIRIAVNLSALSVSDRRMLEHVRRCLSWHGADPAQLVVEITETAAISDMASAKDFCSGLLALGCEVALDDFGAGFGSFQYLKRLPFSYLKIDGDFVRVLPVSHTDQLVVRALAGLARGMGRQTIAEFVGDEETIAILRSFEVDYAQGYAVGRPEPAAAILA